MSTNQHIIRRLAVNLDVQGNHQTNKIRNELLQYLHSELRRLLSTIFDEVAPANEVVRIEKLTLNLGSVKRENLHQKITHELSETLRKAIAGAKRGETQVNGAYISITFSTSNTPVVGREESMEEVANPELEGFLYFLKTGTLPWWNRWDDNRSLDEHFQEIFLPTSKQTTTIKERIRLNQIKMWQVLESNPFVRKRLVSQVNHQQIDRLLKEWSRARKIELVAPIDWVKKLFIAIESQINAVAREQIIRHAIIKVLIVGKSGSQDQLIQFLLRQLIQVIQTDPTVENKFMDELKQLLTYQQKQQPKFAELVGLPVQLQALRKAIEKGELTRFPSVNDLKKEDKIHPISIEDEWKELEQTKTASQPDENKEEPTSQSDIIVFNFAGAVILWPMLSTFFDRLGLMEKSEFKSEKEQFRALALLNYMVSGNEALAEFEMPLHKILCGISIETPLIFTEAISTSEKEEATVLLEHVINTWSVLKSTSPRGLREGFLERKGELIEFSDHWLLKVESKSIDIIMSKLPWGISMIKLPWMEKLIQVEW